MADVRETLEFRTILSPVDGEHEGNPCTQTNVKYKKARYE
jgi:hypothetical protein